MGALDYRSGERDTGWNFSFDARARTGGVAVLRAKRLRQTRRMRKTRSFEMTRLSPFFLAASVVGVLFGCSSQADTAYQGEPLAVLSGTVDTQGAAPPPELYAALAWAQPTFEPNSDVLQSLSYVAQAAPVSGQFPARFTLDVYQPPPTSTLESCSDGANIAIGFLVTLDAAPVSGAYVPSTVDGAAAGTVVVYVDSDRAPGWICNTRTNGLPFGPTKGYHLLQDRPNAFQFNGMGFPGPVEVPLSTPIALTLGVISLPTADSGLAEPPDGGMPTPSLDGAIPPGHP